jgi:hypothetical protein
LATRYISDRIAGKRSGFTDEQMLKKDILPDLKGEPWEEIKRVDVTRILDRIIKRSAPIQANRTFEIIQQAFGNAVEKGFLDTSPIDLMKAPSKARNRDRKLSADEIRVFRRRLVRASPRIEKTVAPISDDPHPQPAIHIKLKTSRLRRTSPRSYGTTH